MAKPIARFRAGTVGCSLWENERQVNGRTVTMLKATIERRFKGSDGTWQSSNSFGRNDIPLVQWCLDQAFTAMVGEQGSRNEAEEEVIE